MPDVRKCITCRYAYFKKGPYQYPTEPRPYRFKCAIMHFVTRKDRFNKSKCLDVNKDYCPLIHPFKDTSTQEGEIKDIERKAILRMYRCGHISNSNYDSRILKNARVDKDLPVVYDYTIDKECNSIYIKDGRSECVKKRK